MPSKAEINIWANLNGKQLNLSMPIGLVGLNKEPLALRQGGQKKHKRKKDSSDHKLVKHETKSTWLCGLKYN